MKTVLVTGCAGFIGSNLVDALLRDGYNVIGVDCLTDYYPSSIKLSNIKQAMQNQRFTFMERDLLKMRNKDYPDAEFVFHLAAQAGVQPSWAQFALYARCNIVATQKLLEAYRHRSIEKLIFASSSSVYGNVAAPYREYSIPEPVSPYGVTKLAAEHLCRLYYINYGLPVVCLRYFTVYGPRQRPDMAIYKFTKAILEHQEVTIHGDGSLRRDFTYISDVTKATIKAAACGVYDGSPVNIGGGHAVSVNELVNKIGEVTKETTIVKNIRDVKGNPRETLADTKIMDIVLGWKPEVDIDEGLGQFCDWYRRNRLLENSQ